MKRNCAFLFLLSIIPLAVNAQDARAPKYMVSQDFPDSVKSLTLLRLDSSNIEFSSLLELHKGKKVVIDFWASWCRDCIVGLPQLEALKQQTGEEKVVYVFISVDEVDTKWRSAITRFNIRGEHYRIEAGWHNSLCHYIELDWVPRYLVLDEKGKVIMAKAVKADSHELVKSLMK